MEQYGFHFASDEWRRSAKGDLPSSGSGENIRGPPRAKRSITDRSEKLFDLPEIPTREERLEILLRERPAPKRNDEQSGKLSFSFRVCRVLAHRS